MLLLIIFLLCLKGFSDFASLYKQEYMDFV